MELTTGLSYPILYERGLMSKSAQCSNAREEMPLGASEVRGEVGWKTVTTRAEAVKSCKLES